MTKTTRMLTAGLVVMAVMGANRPAAAQDRTVTLQVQNRAHVADDVLAQAEAEVTRIYAAAGVNAVWVDDTQVAQVMVKIMTREAADHLNLNLMTDAMGFAPCTRTACGRVAYVLAYRVNDVARGFRMDEAVLLGAAIAHEVGHLLLPMNAHSRMGIMRAYWNDADFRSVSAKQLLFTTAQGALMLTRIAEGN